MLAAIWRLVGQLRRHRIAHRDLRLANIFLDDDGQVWLIDFGFGEVAASDLLLATDVAELLASSSLSVGPERAVAHAAGTVDAPTCRGHSTGSGRGRSAGPPAPRSRPAPGLLDDLRERVAAVPRRPRPMNFWWLILAGVGLVILSASVAAARKPFIGPTETRLFHAVNELPDQLYGLLWLPMQLGNLVVGTGAGLAVALVAGDLGVAIGVLMATALKLLTERVVRREMADYLSIRQRPGTSQTGAFLRGGDVPWSGPSFPSGHVILVAAVGSVVAPELPVAWWWLPAVLTALVMVGRVYVGAHNPLDVTAGLGAGLLLGGGVAAFFN